MHIWRQCNPFLISYPYIWCRLEGPTLPHVSTDMPTVHQEQPLSLNFRNHTYTSSLPPHANLDTTTMMFCTQVQRSTFLCLWCAVIAWKCGRDRRAERVSPLYSHDQLNCTPVHLKVALRQNARAHAGLGVGGGGCTVT